LDKGWKETTMRWFLPQVDWGKREGEAKRKTIQNHLKI